MPIILDQTPEKNIRLGLWQITEPEEYFHSQVHFTPNDCKLYEKMKNENRRKQWLAYRLLLQHLFNHQLIEVRYDRNGKPHLNPPHLHFSASHSGLYAAVITGKKQLLGIDIEKITIRLSRVRERFLSSRELEDFKDPLNLEKLCLYWCGKEALFKVHGRPELDLRNDIYIHSFDYICNISGLFTATMTRPDGVKEFILRYTKLGDYMLVYTYD